MVLNDFAESKIGVKTFKEREKKALLWTALMDLKEIEALKLDFLSEESRVLEELVSRKIDRICSWVEHRDLKLPIKLCASMFESLNKKYLERNVAGTSIEKVAHFLIDYIVSHESVAMAGRFLSVGVDETGKRNSWHPQWYNYAVGSLIDRAAAERYLVCKANIGSVSLGQEREKD